MKLLWSEVAEADLDDLFDYIEAWWPRALDLAILPIKISRRD